MQDDVIIRQGDVGDFFYVLDTGHCDIHVEGVGKVMDVGPGGSFGELALMYDAPRAATVVRCRAVCWRPTVEPVTLTRASLPR